MIRSINGRIDSKMRWHTLKRRSRLYRYFLRIKTMKDPSFQKLVDQTADDYCRREQYRDKEAMVKTIYRFYRKYRVTPGEFEDFRLYGKTKQEIKEYFFLAELSRVFSAGKKNHFPKDKYARYNLFKDCFHRDIQRIESVSDSEKYDQFINGKDRFMVKTIKGDKGKGVSSVESKDVPNITAFSQRYELPVLLEEYIRQGKELAEFHPSSINTVRLVTAVNGQKVPIVVYALFRSGQGGSVVDNVGSGGLIALVDEKKGKILTDALYDHDYYSEHPDTGKVFRGTEFPEWEKMVDIALKAHSGMKEQALIGWDFAWTESGWDLVEANPAPSFASWQTLSGKGIRPLLKELGVL